MNPNSASDAVRLRVGLFTVLGLAMIGVVTVYVNDRPFWWRPCELVQITVPDATGLKTKSPIRSLGLQIGFLKTVELSETQVRLGICITASVEVLPSTKAYIRTEGFLGDKFVELKPVRYTGGGDEGRQEFSTPHKDSKLPVEEEVSESREGKTSFRWNQWSLLPEARADDLPKVGPSSNAPVAPGPTTVKRDGKGREIPVGARDGDMSAVVSQVDELVTEMTELTTNLKSAIDPAELRDTMKQLNKTLENASKALAPEGTLNATAQRTLAKLEDSIEQVRDLVTRVNKGEGSVGMLLNDPTYAEEIRQAVRNVNQLLSRVGGIRFVVTLGAVAMPLTAGSRGWVNLGIWPSRTRYYLLGVASDSRGFIYRETVTTTVGGVSQSTEVTRTSPTSLLFTAMLGKVLWERLDLALGVRFNDAMASIGILFGPRDREEMFALRNDLYTRGVGQAFDYRPTLTIRPLIRTRLFNTLYATTGLDSVHRVGGKYTVFVGGGITFDDDDVKLLFSFL